jgi:Icc-related predicted phosphoesterase
MNVDETLSKDFRLVLAYARYCTVIVAAVAAVKEHGMTETTAGKSHKVAFYADIFYNSELSPAYWTPPANLDVDVILLGGDIHYTPEGLGAMLAEIRQSQDSATRIVVVPGNGEYVDQELDSSRAQYRKIVEAVPNTTWLDDETVVLPGGLRIIGSTLWSEVAAGEIGRYSEMLASYGLKGVDDIRVGDRYLTLRDTNELHAVARGFIAGELLALSGPERAKTIVCTHFWPTQRPWTDEAGRPLEGNPESQWLQGMAADLDELIAESGPRFWLCGHAHSTHHVTIGSTEVASNPRAGDGPGHVNPEFAESYVVEL